MSDQRARTNAFAVELSRLAMKHGISPATGMVCFGHLAGLMIAFEKSRKPEVSVADLQETLMAMFANAVAKGIEDGTKNPPPPPKGRAH